MCLGPMEDFRVYGDAGKNYKEMRKKDIKELYSFFFTVKTNVWGYLLQIFCVCIIS